MKRRLFLASLLLSACGGIATKDVTVDDSVLVSSAPNFANISSTGVSGALNQQGVDPTFIQSATLKSFTLTATSPAGSDLSFFKSGALYIETSAADETEIASAASFPAGQASVAFDVTPNVELKPYLTAASYQVIPQIPLARPLLLTPVQVDAQLVMHVTFKP